MLSWKRLFSVTAFFIVIGICGASVPQLDLRQCSARGRDPGLSVRVYPMGYLDNLFCVLKGTEQPIAFHFMDCIPGKAKKPLTFTVSIPKGFELKLEHRYMRLISSKTTADGGTESSYEVKVPYYTSRISLWGCAFGHISTSIEPDGKKYTMTYSVSSADGKGGTFSTDLMSIPFEQSPVPRIFKSGMFFCELWPTFMDAEASKRGAQLLNNTGFNLTVYNCWGNYPFLTELKKLGITRCWGLQDLLSDGYRMGLDAKPESVQFRNAEGKWVAKGLCPEEAMTQGEYFKKHVLGELERRMYQMDLGDHYIANWEPIPFAGQGCFCTRCKEAFITFSGIPRSDIDQVWPSGILKKYRKEWQKFRASRHAEIMKSIQKFLAEMDAKYKRQPSWLMPEIALANLLDGHEKFHGDMYAEYDARQYENDLPALVPWGPYFMHDFLGAYRALPGRHATMTWVADETVRQLQARHQGKRPKLFGFPQGIQVGSWVTTPEAMAFETLAFFSAGWEGSVLYAFPNGYDGRYWNAMARANRLIAAHEDYVFKGERMTGVQASPVSPYPKGVSPDTFTTAGKYFEKELKQGSMLRSVAYRLDKRICVALANGWESGQVVCLLKLPSIPKGNYRLTLSDSAHVAGEFATAEQLMTGIQVQIPAIDWLFVTIVPAEKDAAPGKLPVVALTADETARLKKLVERDNQLMNSSAQQIEYRFDENPAISAGPVSVKPKQGARPANSILSVTAPGYKGEILMAAGGMFSHIKPVGITLKNGSFIGGEGVWGDLSGPVNSAPYRFEKWSANGDEVTVVLSSRPPIFAGMLVEKTYVFSPENVTVSFKITNTDNAPYRLNFRLRSYFRMMGKPDVFCGTTAVPAEKAIFVTTEAEPASLPFRKARELKGIGATKVTASVPGKAEKTLTVDFLNQDCGVYFWRSVDGTEFTAEKTYTTVELKPGQSAEYKASLPMTKSK